MTNPNENGSWFGEITLKPLTKETDDLFVEYVQKGYELYCRPTSSPDFPWKLPEERASIGFINPEAKYPGSAPYLANAPSLVGEANMIHDYYTYLQKLAIARKK
jgi:hypothetical protein